MFKGFYTAASGMIAQQRRTELLTNNMANAETPGFKSDQSTIRSFPDMLMSAIDKEKVPTEDGLAVQTADTLGAVNAGLYMQEISANQMQGQLIQTDLTTDIALINGTLPVNEEGIQAAVFYLLQEENSEAQVYTRNGNFTLDGAGFLTAADGKYVLSADNEPIQVQTQNFRVNDRGQVFENDVLVAQIGVSVAENPDAQLLKQQNGVYYTANGENLQAADPNTYSMQQSFLEQSNVDAAKTMTDLMTAYRAFEANQKVLTAYDTSMQKAVSEIGRV
ncbi:flagellar hook-basal body protein [Caryophanon latum]|uniref:Flagellar biosynthesis protein FlgC n=1 Tax=Caryophanon latum TaxID=33977 RepID=A0A1C0YDK0_9BACL|nr:flagellar hook-basal body protein [Caryophanon latum]OCS85267.1 flagellar biosynthesis protein FlgC [Caryophanon latum]